MNPGRALDSNQILNAYDRLTAIVGSSGALYPEKNENFTDFLSDETFLQGEADLVLRPKSSEEVVAIIKETQNLREKFPANKNAFSLTLRGGGSGLSGACVPQSGIVLDLTGLNRILEVDLKNRFVRAECGVLLADIYRALDESSLQYAVDPSSSAFCTVGGSIATNAAGPSSLKYGTTRRNLAAVRFATADGSVVHAGSLPQKTSMGFSLPDILCGSEGRLGIILEAELRLVNKREETALVVASFATERGATDFIFALRETGLEPKCIEILDAKSARLVDFTPACPEDGALLMIEFDGTEDEVTLSLSGLESVSGALDFAFARNNSARLGLWAKRKAVSVELKKEFPFRLGEDVAVPLSALSHAMAYARKCAIEKNVPTAIWGHAGDGNLHVNYLLDNKERLPVVLDLMHSLAHEVTRLGGAMSGEHGLGRLKKSVARQVLPSQYFDIQSRIKNAFDKTHLFNPMLELE